MTKAITYYRVSTDRQAQSGLSLDAQQQAVHDFAQSNHLDVIQEFTEVESGRKSNRPVLQCALNACQKERAVLIIAKLDRLARNVALISKLMESKTEFVAVDHPSANKLILHMMAAFAEYERDEISRRTKAALQAAKRRGVELGTNGKYVLSKQNRHAANDFARRIQPLITALHERGIRSLRNISDELNEMEVPTYRGDGYKWHTTTVFNLMSRVKRMEAIAIEDNKNNLIF